MQPLHLHLLTGPFSDTARELLPSLGSDPLFSLRGVFEVAGVPQEKSVEEVLGWLADADEETRTARFGLRIGGGVSASCTLETRRCGVPERLMLGLVVEPKGEPKMSDVQMGLLTLCCRALSREDQGAFLIGSEFGALGSALGRGRIAEQIQNCLELWGERVEQIVAATGTAEALGELVGFLRRDLADQVEYRRS